ncbi:hypothetical protein [Bradyrhizobium sp. 613_E4_N2_2]|uniref:hypothetical protein n=1 Tax=Bradyrhizobium sp. 613_E4_N2_2 TaxID=3240371 RepID=UPI003F8BCD8F
MARLPKSTQEIAEVIGRERALFLVGQLPRSYSYDKGRRVTHLYVPATLKPAHYLVQLLGWMDAMKLVSHFGGEILYPATCEEIARGFRDQNIRRLSAEGMSAVEIAEWFGMSDRQVRNILREIPPEAKEVKCIQPTLIKTTAGAA